MEELRFAWSRFEKSGKIADYMAFCEERRRMGLLPAAPSESEKRGREPEGQSSV